MGGGLGAESVKGSVKTHPLPTSTYPIENLCAPNAVGKLS